MKSFLMTNLCTRTRVEIKDKVLMQVFSGFYSHPAMINEDDWHLMEALGKNILVDEDTMFVMKDMVCEWGRDAASDTILTCKLTSTIEDEDKRAAQWNEKLKYAMDVRDNQSKFYDKKKVDELTQLADISVSENIDSDFVDNSPKPGSVRKEQE